MFLVRRPSPAAIDRFLRDSQHLTLSYDPVGIAGSDLERRGTPSEMSVTIGHGAADFERARAALIKWKHFDLGWVEQFPPHAPIAPGTTVAVLIRHLGLWSLNGCRVLYTVGSPDDIRRFGFAYGTLMNHAEAGEEIFEVFLDPATEDVLYRIRARSWPHAALARIGRPVVRVFQARFRSASALAMMRATHA